ncbi:rRNA maturation RNase YbeY, partial [Patescibacteria group bacterium]|nr:rRNA maturation RNase YbeY [Patescibacteria group bacterium]
AFLHYKEAILGPRYELSVAVVSPAKMRAINRQYRKLDKPTDVLAFPLSKTQGEVFLCLPETKKEAKKFDRGYENFLSFLFIHACVHLLGYDHGTKMEKMEKKWRKKFNI